MKKVYYFAYGSNLLSSRLEARLGRGNIQFKPYTLRGYKLVFNTGFSKKGCFANIVVGLPTDSVEGVLYDITPQELKELSTYERFYETYFFDIGRDLACVYISTDEGLMMDKGKPDLYYLNIIIDGCLEKGLHNTYNSLLDYKIANFKLKSLKHKRLAK